MKIIYRLLLTCIVVACSFSCHREELECTSPVLKLKWDLSRVSNFNGEYWDNYYFPDTLQENYYIEFHKAIQGSSCVGIYARLLRNEEELALLEIVETEDGKGYAHNPDFYLENHVQESTLGEDTLRYTVSSGFPFDENDFPQFDFYIYPDQVQNYFYVIED